MEEIKEEQSVDLRSRRGSVKKSCLSKSTNSDKPIFSMRNHRNSISCRNLTYNNVEVSLSKLHSSNYDSDISLDSDATS